MTAPTSRRRRQRLSGGERRSQIVEVATSQLSERGYWGLSLHDVAVACGLTDAGLLHHVRSKDELLIMLLDHRDEADMDALSEILGVPRSQLDECPGPVPLSVLCRGLMIHNQTQPEIVRLYTVLNGESLDPQHPAHQYFQDREAWAQRLFTSAVPTDHPEPTRLARQVLAAMDGIQLRWLRDLPNLSLVEEWDFIADKLIPDGLSGPPLDATLSGTVRLTV